MAKRWCYITEFLYNFTEVFWLDTIHPLYDWSKTRSVSRVKLLTLGAVTRYELVGAHVMMSW